MVFYYKHGNKICYHLTFKMEANSLLKTLTNQHVISYKWESILNKELVKGLSLRIWHEAYISLKTLRCIIYQRSTLHSYRHISGERVHRNYIQVLIQYFRREGKCLIKIWFLMLQIKKETVLHWKHEIC